MNIVGFMPVFAMEGPEGKLFKPLAFTKTFALLASVILALTMIPPLAHILFGSKVRSRVLQRIGFALLVVAGIVLLAFAPWWVGTIIAGIGLFHLLKEWIPDWVRSGTSWSAIWLAVAGVIFLLTEHWLPLGPEKGMLRNFLFVAILIGGLMAFFQYFRHLYEPLLRWSLNHKGLFLSVPAILVLIGGMIWMGFGRFWGWMPATVDTSERGSASDHQFAG
jgi:Cu(I)/Ag(I) efflux system membrane protein CusA/SilA